MGWGGVPTGAGLVYTGAGLVEGGSGRRGKGWGGCKGFGSGSRDGANFATGVVVVSNAYKKRKMAFFEGCPRGYPPELAWWTGG